jgi:hypothetical protein
VSSRSQPKFIVGRLFGMPRLSVPMYDHEPSSATNEMRICAFALVAVKSNLMLANFVHFIACSITRWRWMGEPSLNQTPRVRPSAHFLPASSAILSGAAIEEAPNSFGRLSGGGAFLAFSAIAVFIARTFSVPLRMRSQHMRMGAMRRRGADLTADLAMRSPGAFSFDAAPRCSRCGGAPRPAPRADRRAI